MDRMFKKSSWAAVPGKLIQAQPLRLKESLRIRDGLGMPDIYRIPKPAHTPVAVNTATLGPLWIHSN